MTTITIDTTELIGIALDWVVNSIENDTSLHVKRELGSSGEWLFFNDAESLHPVELEKYSSEWKYGGPIIDREFIAVFSVDSEDDPFGGEWAAGQQRHQPLGQVDRSGGEGYRFYNRYLRRGPTPLIAAMRCYVACKRGNTVKVPAELITGSSVSAYIE